MKKSILIIGKQGSGKTTKLKQLSELEEKSVMMLDEATSEKEIEASFNRAKKMGYIFMAATQISKEKLSKKLLSKFEEVIEL